MSQKPQPSEEQKSKAEEEIVAQSKRIDFYLTEYSVELLAQKMQNKSLVVPDYQREFTWESERKSRFVESLLIGLPIPFLFFWEMPDGNLEIVDGSQRLRTIHEFIHHGMILDDLDALPSVSGFTFVDLLESRQRKLLNRSIRGIVLNEHADEQARLDMFERINTGSKAANTAEVRRGALAGPFMKLIVELAKSDAFVELAPVSDKLQKEREHEELVTRFFAYSDGLEGYKDRPSDFIFDYVKKMNASFAKDLSLDNAYRARFAKMIEFVARVFPYGFRRTPTGKATPRSRFEAISIGSSLALKADPGLEFKTMDVSGWVADEEFLSIISSDGANAIARLNGRINFVKNRLLET